ncbi:MAG: hypothetical protein ACOYL6_08440 [Bacteriovoracaceae bacterium]
MKIHIILICILVVSCSSISNRSGYLDDSGNPISKYDQIFSRVNAIFAGNCPSPIIVKQNDKPQSEFRVRRSTILLGTNALGKREEMVLAHETTHLCLAQITKGTSNLERFRFFDEGFASIVGGNFSSEYRNRALSVASKKARKGEVSFALVQKWSKYFGDPPNADYEAYEVGASFI